MKGIILLNTGSPRSKEREDVKCFIGTMLSDPLVMTVPDFMRNILAKNIIAPMRASSSAAHYSLIWDNENNQSPLIYNSQKLAQKVEQKTGLPVEIAMRYIEPSIPDAFNRLIKKCSNLTEVCVVPMFPQYAQSSYETAVSEIIKYSKSYSFKLNIIKPYYNKPEYIKSLANSLKENVDKGYDKLLFSYHSLPISHVNMGIKKGNDFDYVYQLEETVRLVTKELNLDPQKNLIVFSSAMGKKWLKPDINKTLEEFAANGVKKVIAMTPGFSVDNLETLYDIDLIAKENFLKNGGEEFTFVPCLNANDYWVDALIQMISSEQQ